MQLTLLETVLIVKFWGGDFSLRWVVNINKLLKTGHVLDMSLKNSTKIRKINTIIKPEKEDSLKKKENTNKVRKSNNTNSKNPHRNTSNKRKYKINKHLREKPNQNLKAHKRKVSQFQ